MNIDNLYKEADAELIDDEILLPDVQSRCSEEVHTSYGVLAELKNDVQIRLTE